MSMGNKMENQYPNATGIYVVLFQEIHMPFCSLPGDCELPCCEWHNRRLSKSLCRYQLFQHSASKKWKEMLSSSKAPRNKSLSQKHPLEDSNFNHQQQQQHHQPNDNTVWMTQNLCKSYPDYVQRIGLKKQKRFIPVAELLTNSQETFPISHFLSCCLDPAAFQPRLPKIMVTDAYQPILNAVARSYLGYSHIEAYVEAVYRHIVEGDSKPTLQLVTCWHHFYRNCKDQLIKNAPLKEEVRNELLHLVKDLANCSTFQDAKDKVKSLFHLLMARKKSRGHTAKMESVESDHSRSFHILSAESSEESFHFSNSSFYKDFFKIYTDVKYFEKKQASGHKHTDNPYYCPSFAEYFLRYKLSTCPLWMQRLVMDPQPSGALLTNKPVELWFDKIKNDIKRTSDASLLSVERFIKLRFNNVKEKEPELFQRNSTPTSGHGNGNVETKTTQQ